MDSRYGGGSSAVEADVVDDYLQLGVMSAVSQEKNFKANYWWREVWGVRGPPSSYSNASLAGPRMNGFKHVMETVCGRPGASSESMVTTFWAVRDASVMRKGPMKSG
uniref:Uncharacterized protein n=1 Tax=Romanomermis culicivorax TaxID=13658 RepID=A0A915KB68_ROMCU